MNVNTLNRTVLAVLIGSALSVGLSAPERAQARPNYQDRAAQSQSQDDEDSARAKREQARKDREEAAAARAEQVAPRAAEAPRVQQAPPVRERDQAQAYQRDRDMEQREQAQLRQQQEQIREQNRQTRERNEQAAAREQAQAERERANAERQQRERAGQRDQRSDEAAQARVEREQARDQREQSRDEREQQRTGQREERRDDRQQATEQRQDRQAQREHESLPPARRLDNRQRDQRIVREKQQARVYQQQIQTQIAPQAKAYAETLNHQHRSHGYRYQQQYYWRLLEMLTRWNWQSYNYWNDPYYYTADDYRYYRGGGWYSINRYGADILRQAINFGYQEGFWAGRADRMDGWRYDYRGSWVYRDGNYGYRGFYVGQREYNYYFREGFRRGYEDGYYSRRHYGRSYNGSDVILGAVLSTILNLQVYRW
jgi:hypothetical protein